MRLTPSEAQDRRAAIIHNAFLLFCTHGIEAVTLTEISRQSHVGRSAIFRYFGSKDNLVLEAFIALWEATMGDLDHTIEDHAGLCLHVRLRADQVLGRLLESA